MIKFKDLVEESTRSTFTTTKQETDPTTGQISWNVKYHPVKELVTDLEGVKELIEKIIRNNPKDLKLVEYYDVFRKLKKSLNTHLNKQYPKK